MKLRVPVLVLAPPLACSFLVLKDRATLQCAGQRKHEHQQGGHF
jgi:hypothetical protein